MRKIGKGKIAAVGAVLLVILFSMSANGAENRVERTTLQIEKLTCSACIRVIDAELRKVRGIMGMDADLRRGMLFVDHEPVLSPQDVARLVTDYGYPAKVLGYRAVARDKANRFRRGPGFGSGPGCSNPCGVNPVADSWRELRRRFFGRGNNRRGPPGPQE